MSQGTTPPGWYHADGDPAGTTRWWDGTQWVGEPQTAEQGQAAAAAAGGWASPPGMIPTPSLAGAGARIGGRVLDILIWLVIILIINIPILGATIPEAVEAAEENRDPVFDVSSGLVLITGLLTLVAIVAYEVLLNVRGGGTPGKRAISARIVKADGSDLDMRAAVLRISPFIAIQVIGTLLSLGSPNSGLDAMLALVVAVVSLIMLFTNAQRQTVWDKIAGTIVVSR